MPNTPKLSDNEIAEQIKSLTGWALDGKQIQKTYKFEDFRLALAFVNQVGGIAEAFDHHPDVTILYNKVRLTLSTHSSGGLTQKDFDLAHKVDAL